MAITTPTVPGARTVPQAPRGQGAGCVLTSRQLTDALRELEDLARKKNDATRAFDRSCARLRSRFATFVAVMVITTTALATIPTGTSAYETLINAAPPPNPAGMIARGAGMAALASLVFFLLYLACGRLWDTCPAALLRELLTRPHRETLTRAHAELDQDLRAVLAGRVFARLVHHTANVSPDHAQALREHLNDRDVEAISRTVRDLHTTAPPCRIC